MAATARTALDRVTGTIVDDILSGRYAPGAALREDELATRLEASRHTVRSALTETTRRRLTVAEPHRGVRVIAIDDAHLAGLQQLRCALESEAVRLVGLRPLHSALVGLDELRHVARTASDDWVAVERAHFRVHLGLLEDAGCDRLTDSYRDLEDEVLLLVGRLRDHYRVEDLVGEHEAYLDALRSEGPAAVRAHLENSRRILTADSGTRSGLAIPGDVAPSGG